MDQPSLESLWEQMHERLLRFIRARLDDPDDAEDILQDVFLRIHAHLGSVRSLDRLESWIYQVARNSISDYYRAHYSHQQVELSDHLPVEDEYSEPDPVTDLLPSLRELVDALPEPYRQALIMTEYEGLTQKELADCLGISLSGAKSRVQRGREKIKDALLTCCHFEFDARGLVYDIRARCCCCDQEGI